MISLFSMLHIAVLKKDEKQPIPEYLQDSPIKSLTQGGVMMHDFSLVRNVLTIIVLSTGFESLELFYVTFFY